MLHWLGKKIKGLGFRLRVLTGLQRTLPTDDRCVLEQRIFPHISELGCRRILFVGCEWYTRCYNEVFADCEYWTIEIDPAKRRFGAPNHVVDSLENLSAHFTPGYFDAIICNGVFGWGLNDREAVETAFRGCLDCLQEGGLLVLGWNDVPERRPFSPLETDALQAFDRHVVPSLGTSDHLTQATNRHTFSFFRKPVPADSTVGNTASGIAAPADVLSLIPSTALLLSEMPLSLLSIV